MIFEYLPHKEKKESNQSSLSSTSISMNRENEESLSSSPSSDNSVIDKLLGRLPIWPSSSTLSSNDAGLNLLNLLQQQQSNKDSSELDHVEINQNSVSIVDRLNEAIRQAQCNNNPNSTTDHRIAVQA